MRNATEPQLDPPGAGLPKVELVIARALMAWRGRRATRAGVNALFARERDAIRALTHPLDAAAATQRVLIPRLRGMEDSSRYWSVWMTLDHLRLIHSTIRQTIAALVQGVVPPGKISTAAVKPSPNVDASVVAAYEKSCDDLLATAAAAPDLKTRARHEHPWFGPLDAARWHMLAAGHLGIHRAQIEHILHGLAAAGS